MVATYEYYAADGTLLYTKTRFEPKGFVQRAASGATKLDGVPRVLYRLPELIEAAGATIYIAEGEKDVDRLRDALGLCAVTANKGEWARPDLVEPLRGRDVVLLPDCDNAGRARALEAAHALHGIAASIRWMALPGLTNKQDLSDWLDANPATNADSFVAMCTEEASLWTPGADVGPAADDGDGITIEDFYAYLPQHCYLFVPTRELWPASSVDTMIPPVDVGEEKPVRASRWLDSNRAVVQMTWAPGLPLEIRDRIINDGGWVERKGVTTLNLYRGPTLTLGNAAAAERWVAHVRRVYPNEAEHILDWLAHRVQRPQDKINHALVLGGIQGIGKDTLLGPVKNAIGPWNFIEASPQNMLGRFNGFEVGDLAHQRGTRPWRRGQQIRVLRAHEKLHRCPTRGAARR